VSKPSPHKGHGPARQSSRWPVALFAVVVVVAAVIVGKALLTPQPVNSGEPAEVQFDQALAQKRVTFALFHSKTCIPCKEMEKTAAAVMPEFKGKITFVDVDVYDEANLNLLRRMQIQVIPTTFIFDRNGQSKVFQGLISADLLRSELAAALSR